MVDRKKALEVPSTILATLFEKFEKNEETLEKVSNDVQKKKVFAEKELTKNGIINTEGSEGAQFGLIAVEYLGMLGGMIYMVYKKYFANNNPNIPNGGGIWQQLQPLLQQIQPLLQQLQQQQPQQQQQQQQQHQINVEMNDFQQGAGENHNFDFFGNPA